MGQLRRGPQPRQDKVLKSQRSPPSPAPFLLSGENTNRQEHLQPQVRRHESLQFQTFNFRIKCWAATCKYHAICHFKISGTIKSSSRDGASFKILSSVSLWVSHWGHFMTQSTNIVFDATVKFYWNHFHLFDRVSQFESANKHSCGFLTSFFIDLPTCTNFLVTSLTNCPFRCLVITD